MKTVRVDHFGGPEQLLVVDQDTPKPNSDQVLIDVKACGINYADVGARSGNYPMTKTTPFYPGFEVAGIVSEVGENVKNLKKGDRALAWTVSGGGYASEYVIDSDKAVLLPESIDFGAATALLVQGLTAYFLLENAQLKEGQTVLIQGAAGGLGTLAVQIAKIKGAKVIGLASESKHQYLKQIGADRAIDYRTPGWSKGVLEITNGKGVDAYLDSQGDLSSEAFDTLGEKAHWLIFGGQSGKNGAFKAENLGTLIFKNLTLRGYTLYSSMADVPRGLKELISWASDSRLKIAVTSFPLADVAKAHKAIEGRETIGKVVLIP